MGAPSVTNVVWSQWTPGSATGVGTFNYTTCNPDCAGGWKALPATIVLSDPERFAETPSDVYVAFSCITVDGDFPGSTQPTCGPGKWAPTP
jgi:hypothetical protein